MEVGTAWALVSLGLVGMILAVSLGLRLHDGLVQRAHQEATTRSAVPAVLVRDATPKIDAIHQGAGRAGDATVSFQGADGLMHEGVALVDGTPRAGDTVQVWVDRQDHIVPAPVTADDATIAGWFAGAVLTAVIAALLALAWFGIRHLTLLRNCAHWEREWTLVEPGWSGRAGRPS